MNKTLMKWAVIPNDCEFSVQYFDSENQAKEWAKTYKSGAQVYLQEVPDFIFDRKQKQTARRGYKI